MREDDGSMIDISGLDMAELLTADQPSLVAALKRILATAKDDAYNSFNSSI